MQYFNPTDWRRVSAAHNQRDESPEEGFGQFACFVSVSNRQRLCVWRDLR